MSSYPPPTPGSLPEMPDLPRRSRYRRPRRYVSWWGLLFGLLVGIGGGLAFAWTVSPAQEVNTAPWQLRKADKQAYVVGIILNWANDGDLTRAIQRLIDLRLPGDDPIRAVADVACDLASTGYVDSNSGLRAIRAMIQFYQLQGRTGCAEAIIPNLTPQAQITIVPPTNTPTIPPPPSKTPTPPEIARPSPTQAVVIVPTTIPQRAFTIVRSEAFCDAELSGVIEVRVQERSGDPIPGMALRVRWDTGQETFFTGLKPERGADYADYAMEEGKAYTVEMPGRSNPSQPYLAAPCTTDQGQEAVQSYRVFFRPGG